MNASKTLTIDGNAKVVIVFSGDCSMGGSSQIVVSPGSSLKIYADANFDMGGSSGIQNGTSTAPNNPCDFTLLGTRKESQIASGMSYQTISVQGTSDLSCVIFVPNGNLTVNGGTHTYGSLVGNTVTMVGNGEFHQDLSLTNLRTSPFWKLLKWRELYTASDRATYASALSF